MAAAHVAARDMDAAEAVSAASVVAAGTVLLRWYCAAAPSDNATPSFVNGVPACGCSWGGGAEEPGRAAAVARAAVMASGGGGVLRCALSVAVAVLLPPSSPFSNIGLSTNSLHARVRACMSAKACAGSESRPAFHGHTPASHGHMPGIPRTHPSIPRQDDSIR